MSTYLFRVEHMFCCHLPQFSYPFCEKLPAFKSSVDPLSMPSVSCGGVGARFPFSRLSPDFLGNFARFFADPSRSTMVHPRKFTKNVNKKEGRMLKGNESSEPSINSQQNMFLFRRVMLGKK